VVNVVDQHGAEVGVAGFCFSEQFLKPFSSGNGETTFPRIGLGFHDLHAVLCRIPGDDPGLVFSGVLLMLGGHPDILLCAYKSQGGFGSCCSMTRAAYGRVLDCNLIVTTEVALLVVE
jgi:hypothetical protein